MRHSDLSGSVHSLSIAEMQAVNGGGVGEMAAKLAWEAAKAAAAKVGDCLVENAAEAINCFKEGFSGS